MLWLTLILFFPLVTGLLLLVFSKSGPRPIFIISLTISLLELLWVLLAWNAADHQHTFVLKEQFHWIANIGAYYLLAMDGINFLLVLLTAVLTPLAIIVSWNIKKNFAVFNFLILAIETGIMGVFLAHDLLLFYVFWELMLVPMYFLVALWGHENSLYAALKFFLYTVTGSLIMLVAILALYFVHGSQTGQYSFSYFDLLGTQFDKDTAYWIMLGFFIGFGVKIPIFPIHSWLPDAHTEAPTAGSMILAGLLLKTGAYGMLRFILPIFPDAVIEFAPIAMALGVIGILYGGLLSLVQQDMKRLIAFSSVSHMGFIVLGLFATTLQGLHGAVVLMLAHGVTTSALFALVGMLQERSGTRDMNRFGGLLTPLPIFALFLLLFTLSAMGMPGLANFAGEFLVLAGAYQVSVVWAALGAAGIIGGVVYLLWMYQRTMLGQTQTQIDWADLTGREILVVSLLALAVLWIGLYPSSFMQPITPALENISSLYHAK